MRPERVETLIAGGLVVELVLSSEAQREGRRPSVGRCGQTSRRAGPLQTPQPRSLSSEAPHVAGPSPARPAGFEPATSRSGGERSIH